jgi:hypothetical protein
MAWGLWEGAQSAEVTVTFAQQCQAAVAESLCVNRSHIPLCFAGLQDDYLSLNDHSDSGSEGGGMDLE